MKILSRFLSTFCFLVVAAAAFAQFEGAKITFYKKCVEDAKIGNKLTLSDPFSGPAEYDFLAGRFNVFFSVKWAKPLAKNTPAKILVLDEKGTYANGYDSRYFEKGMIVLNWRFIMPPGKYTLQLVNADNADKVYVSASFAVVDRVGARATGNQKAGQAKFWVCQTVDDDWKAVGATGDVAKGEFTWPANKPFEVLVTNNSVPFGVSFLGFIIHKQGADGKDTDFVQEWQTDMLDEKKTTKWCTVGSFPGFSGLDPGAYSIYVIDWTKRQPTYHSGNFTEYFAKIKLVVK